MSASVTCSTKGFNPVITYKNNQGWDVTVNVILGNNFTISGCNTTSNILPTSSSMTLSAVDFGDGNYTEIPFHDGSDVSCGGKFEHYVDNSTGASVDKIKYQVRKD